MSKEQGVKNKGTKTWSDLPEIRCLSDIIPDKVKNIIDYNQLCLLSLFQVLCSY